MEAYASPGFASDEIDRQVRRHLKEAGRRKAIIDIDNADP
jgi:hypothetical protein